MRLGALALAMDVPAAALALYRRIPEEARRCLRPLNLVDEGASALPAHPRARVVTATETVRRLVRLRGLRYPLVRLSGPVAGGEGTLACLLAADAVSTRYWARTLFAGPPAVEPLGEVAALHVRAAARRLAPTADLSLWQTSWPLWRLAPSVARVPAWVPLWLRTDCPLDAVVRGERSGRAARKNDVRRVERLGLAVRMTHDRRAFEAFRCELHAPFVRRRFGDLAVPLPPYAVRHARRHGWLLLLERDGRTAAGALLERWRGDVRILAFGVDPDGPLPGEVAIEACYYHAIRFAVARDLPRLGLGTCRPVLTDGVLRYKRKWGASLGPPDTWDGWWLHWRDSAATRAALTAAPLVVERGRGRLAALVGATGTDAATRARELALPGLEEITCLTGEAVTSPAAPPPSARE
jgi:hypothetical protein